MRIHSIARGSSGSKTEGSTRSSASGAEASATSGITETPPVRGAGEVSGPDREFQTIGTGEAVFWSAGEEHETRTDDGLTALIIEGPGLQPFLR